MKKAFALACLGITLLSVAAFLHVGLWAALLTLGAGCLILALYVSMAHS